MNAVEIFLIGAAGAVCGIAVGIGIQVLLSAFFGDE